MAAVFRIRFPPFPANCRLCKEAESNSLRSSMNSFTSGLFSAVSAVEHGVTQRPSIGPLLFSLYIAPLSNVLRSYSLTHNQYADDSQIYVSALKNELTAKANLLEQCTAGVHVWLLHNGLQLNPQKYEVIHFIAGRGGKQADDLDTFSISGATI